MPGEQRDGNFCAPPVQAEEGKAAGRRAGICARRPHHRGRCPGDVLALLDSGTFKSVVEIARAEELMPTTVGRLLRLARLTPDIVEQFMMGCQPRRLTLLWLMRNDIPALWPDQRQMPERFR